MSWPAVGHKLNARFAVITGEVWDLSTDPPEPRRAENVRRELACTKVQETPDGPAKPIFDLWLKWPERRTYRLAVFDPSQPARTGVPSSLSGMEDFNLWPGFVLQPSAAGSCDLFRDHLLHVVCAGSAELFQWVEMWLAHIVQAPARLAGTALALKGPQGAGKSIVGEVMRAILGPALHVSLSKPELITGRFNVQHVGKTLLQAEEAFWAGDKAAAGALKHMITSDRVLIERKGIDPVDLPNYARVLVTSNAEWVVPAGLGERRFAVLQVTGDRRNDRGYWAALRGQMFEYGGCARFMDHLLHHVTVDWDVISRPPMTAALVAQQIEGLGSEDQWLYSILQDGMLPEDWRGEGVSGCEELARDFGASTERRWRTARASSTRLGQYLLKTGPLAGHVRKRRLGPRNQRRGTYVFPPLTECRELFQRYLGARPDWDEVDEWEAASGPFLEPAEGPACHGVKPQGAVSTPPEKSPSKGVVEVGHGRKVGHGQESQRLTASNLLFGVKPRFDTEENKAELGSAASWIPSNAPPASNGWGGATPLDAELLARLVAAR